MIQMARESFTVPQIFVAPHIPYKFSKGNRLWQGCPSIARTTGGRIFASWYSGDVREPLPDNYCVIVKSDDNGKSWQDPYLIIKCPESVNERTMDAQLWTDPQNRLWIFWGQTTFGEDVSCPIFLHDGRFGVWAMICECPDAKEPLWSSPKRLCNGFLHNKPTVMSTGEWVMCAYDWIWDEFSYYVSLDNGCTWQHRKGPHKTDERASHDEAFIVERKDGSWWFLSRVREGIGQSFSFDRGKTWSALEAPAIANPYSRFFIGRLHSGNWLMVNHVNFTGRNNLTALLSEDDGKTWPYTLLLDERSAVSYPEAVQGEDGVIDIIYDRGRTTDREILHARITEADIIHGRLTAPGSFEKQIISKISGNTCPCGQPG